MELWNKCSEKLENTLSQEDFNTWIRPLKAKIDKNTLELVAPNDFILDYIEKNYSKEIKKIVKSQSKSSINLVFKALTKETFIDNFLKISLILLFVLFLSSASLKNFFEIDISNLLFFDSL